MIGCLSPFARILPIIGLFAGRILGDFGVFIRFWAHLFHDAPSFMKDQAVEIVSQVGQCQFGFGPLNANGANEKAKTGLLVRRDMFDPGPNR